MNSIRKHVVYHVDCVIEACNNGDAPEAQRHIDALVAQRSLEGVALGYALYAKALLARLNSSTDECTSLLSLAHESFLDCGQKQAAGVSALTLVKVSYDYNHCKALADRAYRLFRDIDDHVGMGRAQMAIGTCHMQREDYDRARSALLKAETEFRLSNDVFAIAGLLSNLSVCALHTSDINGAVQYSQKSVDMLESMRNNSSAQIDFLWKPGGWTHTTTSCDSLLASAYVNHGYALASIGQVDLAVKQYEKSLAIMRSLKRVAGEAMVLNQIGFALQESNDHVHALDFFTESVALFEVSHTRGPMLAIGLRNLGVSNGAIGNVEAAQTFYERSLSEYRDVGNKAGEAELLVLTGELLASTKQFAVAIPILEKGLAIAQSISNTENIVRANRALGSALMQIDSSKAREHFGRALLIAEEMNMKFEQQNIHRDLFRYYKFTGDTTQALSHHERHHALKEQLFTEESDRRLKNLQIMYGVERYKQSLEESENKIRALETELGARTSELSTVASRIVEKQEFVEMTERGLTRILEAHPEDKDDRARDLLRLIRKDNNVKRDWEEFTKQFMSVHRDYADRLMELAPDVSPAELKVCVLLRLSMSTKQIADVLNLSDRSVDNHRMRIRKKLGIVERENLFTYLMSLDSSKPTLEISTLRH